jgi:hypothetical protein
MLCTGHHTIINDDGRMPSHKRWERTGGEGVCHDARVGRRQPLNCRS